MLGKWKGMNLVCATYSGEVSSEHARLHVGTHRYDAKVS